MYLSTNWSKVIFSQNLPKGEIVGFLKLATILQKLTISQHAGRDALEHVVQHHYVKTEACARPEFLCNIFWEDLIQKNYNTCAKHACAPCSLSKERLLQIFNTKIYLYIFVLN